MEPERFIQFRVAWIDDVGSPRMNRGYRIQYSSAIGPYEGAIHLGHHVNSDVIKAFGFDSVFANALTGFDVGAAVGGADINPYDKSEAEIQRFCQSYMTELAKYVGPDLDQPTMGMGVGEKEVGYLFGQYKRINIKSSSGGNPFLSARNVKVSFAWRDQEYLEVPRSSISFILTKYNYIISIATATATSTPPHQAPGFGVVHFANEMLKDRGDSLEGKRCLIVGSGKVARSVAEKLIEFGAIPITFSDASGHVYEPDGIDIGRLNTINKIKDDRGALLGRYIIASTTAQFNDPESVFDIPCDLCFPCAGMGDIDEAAVGKLANNGCKGIVEGGHSAVTPEARKTLKKRGLMYAPSTLTLTGNSIVYALGKTVTDEMLAKEIGRIYSDVKLTAQEFNQRGDLYAGANIAGFLRVANVMLNHGAV